MQPRLLTKSRFKLALECPNKLYYTRKEEYANAKKEDAFLEALAQGGFQVEELARLEYPQGVLIEGNDGDYDWLVSETDKLLQRENVVIFEAAFKHENLFIRTDILVKRGNDVQLIEVKAKSFDPEDEYIFIGKRGGMVSGWKPYLFDVAFQRYVMQKCRPQWKISSCLMMAASSISDEGDVLFIVDGDVVTDYEIASADVLSIKVLKAEEAVALYGSRAANGVVIITTKKGMEALQNVKARKDLDETAFFFPDLRLGKDGKLEFSFTSPEALTQWKLRLLAHTKDWSTGSYQNTVRTQKELSVVPNAPRFLRETDTITFKTKISNLSSEAMTGTAILELYDALSMKPIDSLLGNKDRLKNFSAAASGNTVVSWNLTIPEGVQAVTYRVLAKAGNFSDGEENFLPVLSNRMLVKESLPFFVRAGETETYVFKNMQENNSNTLEHHKYTLEYSSNPAWYAIQSLPYLIEFEHECSEQTFARLYANSVAGKIMNSQPKIREVFEAWQKDSSLVSDLQKREELKDLILAETPWIRDAASEAAQKQLLAQLFDGERLQQEEKKALQRLEQMQQSSGAWPWFSGGRPSQFITRHIVAGLGHLDRLGIELEDSKMTKKAIAYLDREILISLRESYDKEKVLPQPLPAAFSLCPQFLPGGIPSFRRD